MPNQEQPLWWQRGVIYQIYPRSFMDANGDGVGDLAGVIQRLDYLSEILGVDAIWLSPFYPSPMADFGYDVTDYTGVDSLFGDLGTFDELLHQAHQRGLKLIIDFIPNHTSDRHPWFVESRLSRSNPKRDWYVWVDALPDGSPPNNWLSVFGGPAWQWDPETGQYYLHSFLKEQPDLNWRNPQVKAAMFEALRFWLERGVDGFRFDVAHFIMKDPLLRDNPIKLQPSQIMHKSLGEYDTQIHLYDHSHPDIHAVYRELRQLLDDYSVEQPRFSVGEIHIFNWRLWASYYGQNLDELHMPFNFQLLGVKWQAHLVQKLVEKLEAALPPGAWPNYVLGNHDEARLASRIGREQCRLAAMLLLTLRGTPTLYYGDELGMLDVPIKTEDQQDPWGKRVPGLGRDPNRTPMQWNSGPHAGFSPPEARRTWLPLAEDYRQVNVESYLEEPTSLLNLYRKLLAYRKTSPSLQIGDYWPMVSPSKNCFAYLRQSPSASTVLVILNFSTEELLFSAPELGAGQLVLSTYLDRHQPIRLEALKLRGNEGVLIELEDRFAVLQSFKPPKEY